MVQRDRIVHTFCSLVRIDSETKCERDIADELAVRFRCLGLDVVEDDTAERTGHEAGNLIVTWPPTAGYEAVEPILFTCHMDTVTPGKGIQPMVCADGVIRSDGTTILGSDDKAGIAALLEAITSMIEEGQPHGCVQLVITVGEESGLVGAQAMDASHVQAKYGYALDSDGRVGSICVGGPSQVKLRMVVRGVAAHAGCHPEQGVSAINIAARAIARLPLGRIDAQTTANIGRIEGGGPTNIVADYVQLQAEARSHDPQKLTEVVDHIREIFAFVAEQEGGSAEVEATLLYEAYALAPEDRVVAVAMKAFASLGIKGETFVSGGGSDANVLNAKGIPTVNLGIGYESIHTTNEHIRVDDLVSTAQTVVAIVDAVANGYDA